MIRVDVGERVAVVSHNSARLLTAFFGVSGSFGACGFSAFFGGAGGGPFGGGRQGGGAGVVADAAELEVPRAARQQAWDALDGTLRDALEQAAARIRAYAAHQKLSGFEFTDALGNRLGQQVTALERVGIYVPGGKAAYPSSVLMNAIPAKVAGVTEVVMVVPTPRDDG